MVSPRLAILLDDEWLVAYSGQDPIYACGRDDRDGLRLAAGMLSHLQLAGVQALAAALGVSRETVRRNRKLLTEGGIAAVRSQKSGPKAAYRLTAPLRVRAQGLLDQGWSIRRTATEVGVAEGTVRLALRAGRLQRPKATAGGRRTAAAGSSPSARAHQDQACSPGVAVKRTDERALACVGALAEALPEFMCAEAVSGAGVLLALPALLGQGLIEVTQTVFGGLRPGFFGLRSVVLMLAFMALLRLKTPEQLSGQPPGELGLLLGLDRAPEVKTLRRKLAEMGARGLARLLHQRLAERWAGAEPEQLGLLYLDGHVRPYHGRAHQLPKQHVQQRGRPMPGTEDFHVNDTRAEPLFVITAAATEGLLTMMDEQLLPEIRRLVGPQRRVTLVFDREGWSPQRFAAWKAQDFDVLTYRKGQQSCWQTRFFAPVEGRLDGRPVRYQLAERRVTLSHGLRLREVRRLTDDGHQTSVLTTNERLSTLEVAQFMFNRWRQENFFRYMRHEFALDHLCTTQVEPADPQRLVPHPQRKQLDQQLRAAQTARDQLAGRRTDLRPGDTLRVKGHPLSDEQLDELLQQRAGEIQRLQERRAALPKKVPLDQLLDPQQIVQLERERKLLTDAFKLLAYRAESQLARAIEPWLGRHEEEARAFLQSVFLATADLLPDQPGHILTVRFHGLASPRATRALRALCEIVNATPTCYPGTDLRLRFEAPECHMD